MPLIAEERMYLARYQPRPVGLGIHEGGSLTDPVGNSVLATMRDGLDQAVFTNRAATRVDEGLYEVALGSDDLAVPGPYDITWTFDLPTAGASSAVTAYMIGESAPVYDALEPGLQAIVESVWAKFADLFDSPWGGPHLQVYFQTHFGRNRLAQLLTSAVSKLNVKAQPHGSYTVEDFPHETWGGLVEQMLYVEVLDHLRRSYIEQPNDSGVTVAYADRRDYSQRWADMLRDAKADLEPMEEVFKIKHMGLSRSPRLLVAGGVFGRAPGRRPPTNAARTPFTYRFY